MVKCLWLLLFAFFFTASAVVSHLRQSAIAIQANQTERSCRYTLIIKTSCSSIVYTSDRVSLAFGDAYGNQVYLPRIDYPQTRTFERCSTYVFEVRGPCMDLICFLFIMRNGSDGWKPESTMIYGPDFKPIIFDLDTFLPNGVWFGVTACFGTSSSAFFNCALF